MALRRDEDLGLGGRPAADAMRTGGSEWRVRGHDGDVRVWQDKPSLHAVDEVCVELLGWKARGRQFWETEAHKHRVQTPPAQQQLVAGR